MSKKKGFFLTALFGTLGGGLFLGRDSYRSLIQAKRPSPSLRDADAFSFAGASVREITLDSIDSLRLHATFLASEEEDEHDYVLLLHDAGGTNADAAPYAKDYHAEGCHVLLPHLRGCGLSEGSYLGYGADDALDALSFVHWILKRDPEARILLHGLGAGAAALLNMCATHVPSAVYGVIADSCYGSLSSYLKRKLMRRTQSRIPVRLRLFVLRVYTLLAAGYDINEVQPERAVQNMTVPALFLHGDADREVPVEDCRTLYRRAHCARQIGIFLNAGHLEGFFQDHARYRALTNAFIRAHHPDRL